MSDIADDAQNTEQQLLKEAVSIRLKVQRRTGKCLNCGECTCKKCSKKGLPHCKESEVEKHNPPAYCDVFCKEDHETRLRFNR